jgi:MFS family permease
MIYLPGLPLWLFVVLIALTGVATGGMILSFAWSKESVPARLGGTVSGAVNMGIMLGPTLLQPAVGWVLDRHWTGGMAQGARIYGLAAYQAGFGLMMVWAVLAVILLALAKETHCRQMV